MSTLLMEKNQMSMKAKTNRTTQGLRDALFDEIEELRSGDGDPSKSLAVANLAKQIINTAKIELDFVRTIQAQEATGTPVKLGQMVLGSTTRAASADKRVTDH
jgi:hypothetical protein